MSAPMAAAVKIVPINRAAIESRIARYEAQVAAARWCERAAAFMIATGVRPLLVGVDMAANEDAVDVVVEQLIKLD